MMTLYLIDSLRGDLSYWHNVTLEITFSFIFCWMKDFTRKSGHLFLKFLSLGEPPIRKNIYGPYTVIPAFIVIIDPKILESQSYPALLLYFL